MVEPERDRSASVESSEKTVGILQAAKSKIQEQVKSQATDFIASGALAALSALGVSVWSLLIGLPGPIAFVLALAALMLTLGTAALLLHFRLKGVISTAMLKALLGIAGLVVLWVAVRWVQSLADEIREHRAESGQPKTMLVPESPNAALRSEVFDLKAQVRELNAALFAERNKPEKIREVTRNVPVQAPGKEAPIVLFVDKAVAKFDPEARIVEVTIRLAVSGGDTEAEVRTYLLDGTAESVFGTPKLMHLVPARAMDVVLAINLTSQQYERLGQKPRSGLGVRLVGRYDNRGSRMEFSFEGAIEGGLPELDVLRSSNRRLGQ